MNPESKEQIKFMVSKKKRLRLDQSGNRWNRSRKPVEKIDKTKSWLIERIKKMDKPVARFTRRKTEKTESTEIKNERGASVLILKKLSQYYE